MVRTLARVIGVLTVVVGLLVFSEVAHALDIDAPVANERDITTWLGQVRYSMLVCESKKWAVQIDVTQYSSWNGGFPIGFLWGPNPYRAAVAEVTRRAIPFAVEHCPRFSTSSDNWANVVYEGEIEYSAQNLQYTYDSSNKRSIWRWAKMYDFTSENWWNWVDRWFLILLSAAGLAFVLWHWERIARWYFFLFYPHPAARVVRRALSSGHPLDGPALAAALGEVPPGSSVFRKVRFEQAEALVARMQAASQATVYQHARSYEHQAAAGYERAAVIRSQEAVALAAVALEKAKAAWQASEAIKRRRRA